MRQSTALAIAAALVLAACSGGADEATPTTPAPSTTAVATTSTATTASPPPTTPAPTTPAPTTAPPTTAPRDVTAEVTDAMNDYYAFYWACIRTPAECDPSLVSLPDSDSFNALTRTRDDLVSAGFFVGDEPEGYMVVESIEVMSDHVLARTCWWSTAVLYGPPAPDGTPVVQNDTNGSSREEFQFVEDAAGAWKVRRGDTIESIAEENLCDAGS
jgi:hypothetical protein